MYPECSRLGESYPSVLHHGGIRLEVIFLGGPQCVQRSKLAGSALDNEQTTENNVRFAAATKDFVCNQL